MVHEDPEHRGASRLPRCYHRRVEGQTTRICNAAADVAAVSSIAVGVLVSVLGVRVIVTAATTTTTMLVSVLGVRVTVVAATTTTMLVSVLGVRVIVVAAITTTTMLVSVLGVRVIVAAAITVLVGLQMVAAFLLL